MKSTIAFVRRNFTAAVAVTAFAGGWLPQAPNYAPILIWVAAVVVLVWAGSSAQSPEKIR